MLLFDIFFVIRRIRRTSVRPSVMNSGDRKVRVIDLLKVAQLHVSTKLTIFAVFRVSSRNRLRPNAFHVIGDIILRVDCCNHHTILRFLFLPNITLEPLPRGMG